MRPPTWQDIVLRYLQTEKGAPAFLDAERAFCDGLKKECATALAEAAAMEPSDGEFRHVVDRLEDLLGDLAIAYRSGSFKDGREVALYRECYEQMHRLVGGRLIPDADSLLPDELMPPSFRSRMKSG